MAMGKSVIVANRGMLPELVENGISGLVVEDTPERLAHAALQVLRDPKLKRRIGNAAYQKAHRDFQLDRQVEAIESFYQEMIRLGKWKQR
jgi:glycosyltransferase involved in cell wall biosynthesis